MSMIVAAVFLATTLQRPKPIDEIVFSGKVELPMAKTRSQVVVNGQMNGKAYRFAVDTGAYAGRISKAAVAGMNLRPVGKARAGDPSGKNERDLDIYRIPEVRLGNAVLRGVEMVCDDGPAGLTPSKRGFDCVLGAGLFEDVLLTFDFPRGTVVLSKGSLAKASGPGIVSYRSPFGVPIIDLRIGSLSLEGHVDTGSPGMLLIPSRYEKQLKWNKAPILRRTAQTNFNSFAIREGVLTVAPRIGGKVLRSKTVEMADIFPVVNIGCQVLSQFTVTIDQQTRKIAFI